ncbi:ROK family protein [Hymenobacter terrenus]|uniref:ROK family protein n=1 Tax=Hymenobacter terrenus TaxID=1629124 RepID=UPI000619B273|nr:ROK family protein [Hymenobacter terrenus]
MKKLAIGIDIGGTRTKLGLVDLAAGKVEDLRILPTETKDGTRFLQGIGQAIRELKTQAADQSAELMGVGVGVSGFVWADGRVDTTYGFLEFMEDYPLAALLQEEHHLPCWLDNDARAVALGEALYGQGRGHGRVLTLTLGTGLGVGFTVAGRLEGALPYAHMAGHLTITTNDTACYCGKTGCLESLVSAGGVLQLARRHWTPPAGQPLTAEAIFRAQQAGDPVAESVVEEYVGYLRTGIDNYVNLYAPDLVVLGGGIAQGLRELTPHLHNPALLNPFKSYRTRVVVSELAEHAGILGSAALGQ